MLAGLREFCPQLNGRLVLSARAFSTAHGIGEYETSHGAIQNAQRLALILDQELGITNHVYKRTVSDPERRSRFSSRPCRTIICNRLPGHDPANAHLLTFGHRLVHTRRIGR